ncbi:MAG TPA: hypothetical protein VL463_14405 [Kofleriaceae bacterium]|nr:hypothetical protein [Kofleriaceae bacterium]
MRVPQWLSLLVAAWVIVFGLYRLWIARDPRTDQRRAEGKKGMFVMKRSTQALLGVVYLLLGAALIATSFGWNPLSSVTAPDTNAPASSKPKSIEVK